MAATTPSEILARFKTVLETEPLNLTANPDPFTDEGVPNTLIDQSFRLVHGGMVHEKTIAPGMTLRIDRVTVSIYRAMQFDGYQAQQDLQDQLDLVQRELVADGTEHSYMASVEKGSRKVTRIKESDVCIASLNFLVDFDWDESND
jgi:hypothetical protein